MKTIDDHSKILCGPVMGLSHQTLVGPSKWALTVVVLSIHRPVLHVSIVAASLQCHVHGIVTVCTSTCIDKMFIDI